jgi:putative membrane protein
MKNSIILFLKGILMGICDVIPGISGGTIAFITGIYAQLINAVKSFSPKLISDFFRYLIKRNEENLIDLKEGIKALNLSFLIPLGLGIGTAIFVGSGIMSFLLDNYFVYTISFFIGLILASSKIIYNNIKNHHSKNILFGIFGLLMGISLAVLVPAQVTPSLIYILLGGFLAISAMFLPGISGAFILLIMGIYEFMLQAIHNISENLIFIIIFIIGAALGAFVISRLISFLFKKDKCKTLYVLLGLVIGSLTTPIKRIFQTNQIWNMTTTTIIVTLFLLGFFIVRIVYRFKKKK